MIMYKWTGCNSVFRASFFANQGANKEEKMSLIMNNSSVFYSYQEALWVS